MKKSLVSVSVIAIFSAALTGGAWYTGKQFHQHLPSLINDANTFLYGFFPQSDLQFAVQNYRRGVFTSHIDVVLQSDDNTGDNKLLKSGEEVRFNEKIDHGPFPFAQLKKGVLIPSMTLVHSVLAKTLKTQPLFDASKNHVLFVAEARFRYGGSTVSKITMAPMDFQDHQMILYSSGGTFNIMANNDASKLKASGGITSFVLVRLNQRQKRERLTLYDFTVDNDTHNGEQGYTLKARASV